ncbi:hypothetical protein WSK_3783 [Novosphingobium sp. Rr 2-17]|uniref:hypothetical protein n=1 Tax=Novosphingobium sp. Rr 2-17 TaxID=555793 RepID=UPI00026985A0|nr:hypothetical protein [Novosphingobium sp. Rr 2-17]EIZ77772.1 hypothetical protein WSK_3783 [Novosphingobium sp. Rr 2-17]
MSDENPFITFVVGADQPNKEVYLPALAERYAATRTLDAWAGTPSLEPGDLVLVETMPQDIETIGANVILLPPVSPGEPQRGVMFQKVSLEDALAAVGLD